MTNSVASAKNVRSMVGSDVRPRQVLMEDQEGEQDDWLAKKTLQHLGLSLERIKENAKLRLEMHTRRLL